MAYLISYKLMTFLFDNEYHLIHITAVLLRYETIKKTCKLPLVAMVASLNRER